MTIYEERSTVPQRLRCPSCGAHNAAQAGWCSLCFVALTTTSDDPAEATTGADGPSLPVPVEHTDRSGQGPEAGPSDRPTTDDRPAVDEAQVEELMARLVAEQRSSERSTALSGVTSSAGARAAVMVAGATVLSGVCFGLMALLGSLL